MHVIFIFLIPKSLLFSALNSASTAIFFFWKRVAASFHYKTYAPAMYHSEYNRTKEQGSLSIPIKCHSSNQATVLCAKIYTSEFLFTNRPCNVDIKIYQLYIWNTKKVYNYILLYKQIRRQAYMTNHSTEHNALLMNFML